MIGTKVRVLLGPPGTGKTWTILARIDAHLAAGVPPEEIAYCTYSKAMATEAIEKASAKFQLDPGRFPWFRTIHSMAYRAMGGERIPVMGTADWKAFGESLSLTFTDAPDDGGSLNYAQDGDCLLATDTLARVMCTGIAAAIGHQAGSFPPRVTVGMVERFRKRLTEYKAAHKKLDFIDMLEVAAVRPWCPPVRHAYVDEAQDNAKLMATLTKRWFIENARCETVTYAGDDDQGIHGWAGADKRILLWLARHAGTEILRQSYRNPASVTRLGQRIIAQNTDRVAKAYQPRPEEGLVRVVGKFADALGAGPGSTMVLVRNKQYAARAREVLLASGTLFSSEVGETSPLCRKDELGAFMCIAAWRAGRNATCDEFVALLSQVPRVDRATKEVYLPLGVKKLAKANEASVPLWRARDEYRLHRLVESVVGVHPFALLQGMGEDERRYCDLVLHRDPGLAGPRCVVTSQHRSKGREADNVVVLADVAYPVARNLDTAGPRHEEENCVAYVAVTRARNTLTIVRPQGRFGYDYGRFARA